mmetsp:Transcript_121/g.303  ORF Transcript_121/g.303 Transcript_121/m.303 type:complete len:252 (-) Transcript_121:906-1661(-)
MCAPSQCNATPNASLNATSVAKNSTYAANDDGSGTGGHVNPDTPASSRAFLATLEAGSSRSNPMDPIDGNSVLYRSGNTLMSTAAGARGTNPTTLCSLYDCASLTCSLHSCRRNPRYTFGRMLLNFDMNACLNTSTTISDDSTMSESFSILRVSPPATLPAAVTRCAATKTRQMLRCTRSTMSSRATENSLAASIFLKMWLLISPKLLEISTSSMALVCELIATDRVTAWVSMIAACAHVAASVSAASNAN